MRVAVPPTTTRNALGGARYATTTRHVLEPAHRRLQASPATGYLVGDTEVPFAAVGEEAARIAAALGRAGLTRGEPVALCGPPSSAWVGAAFGILAAGGALTPVDQNLVAGEREALIERTGIRRYVPLADGPELDLDAARPVPGAPRPLTLDGGGDDVAVILHTSGSTGRPKAVELTHDNLIQSLYSFVDVFGCTGSDRTCIAVPLFHVTGLVDQLLQMAWLGGSCRLLESSSTTAMLESLVEDDITVMFAVPAVFALLVRRPPPRRLALRLAVYGGAPIGLPTIEGLLDLVPGIRPVQGYGMTEMTSLATALPESSIRSDPSSVGVPSPITDLRVVGDDGRECGHKQIGEILMRGPHRTRGYRGDDDETARAIDADGWLHSGDLAWRNERGLLHLAGRRTDIINRGGEKISPREIEAVLCRVPGVAEAVSFALQDDVLFEIPAAAVVLEPGRHTALDAINQAVATHLAAFKRPVVVSVVGTLPLGDNGKPDLAALRELARAELAATSSSRSTP